jgi:homoserine O-acetyltransferase
MIRSRVAVSILLLCAWACAAAAVPAPAREGDFVMKDFTCANGEVLPSLRMHYLTLGQPHRGANGAIDNAVLIMHGTGGTGRQFLSPQFANVLYPAGGALDTTRFWLILPDDIGHGRSSKPSDGLHMKFPHYGYADMVTAEYRLVTEYLGASHLRLVMGTSMGAMHTWMWATRYPAMMDALMPLACEPVAIVGRNRLWRDLIADVIRHDPEWQGGEYTQQPAAAMRAANAMLAIAGSAPSFMQKSLADRDTVDRYIANTLDARAKGFDANDLLYQLDASRDYDPSPLLEKITAPLVLVNSADDFINPPELGLAEREIGRVKNGRFVLIPASGKTHGHGTHTWAALWQEELRDLLARTENLGKPRH